MLRYYGGKNRLAWWICSFLPEHEFYVEPYCGAASVFVNKTPVKTEVLNDIDDRIVTFLKVLRDRPKALQRALLLTPHSRTEYNRAWHTAKTPLEVARRVVVRAFQSFGGNGLHDKTTGFRNTAGGNSGMASYVRNYQDAIETFAERLRGVVIENRPALDLMDQMDTPGVVFYVDPPYLLETRCCGHQYTHEMSRRDHCLLLERLNRLRGRVLLSGYRSKLYDDALPAGKWTTAQITTRAERSALRTETLWMNFKIEPYLFDDVTGLTGNNLGGN